MKESEFLELLNLYLDHEISAADAARLEAEVQSNPARHRTYLEYCRMQKACTILAKDFAQQSDEKKVVAFEPRRAKWGGGWYAIGGLAAAAAAIAVVLAVRAPGSRPAMPPAGSGSFAAAGSGVVQTVDVTTAIPAVVSEKLPGSSIARTVTVPSRRAELKPVFVVAQPAPATSASQLEWMRAVQIAPMQSLPEQDVRLDPRSPLQPARRTYTNGRQVQGSVEMAAFRFQK